TVYVFTTITCICYTLNKYVSANIQGEVPLQGDFSAEHMIFGVEGIDPVRRDKLIDLLDIDLRWRMHKVSDGQRRRVQICMGLLHPFKVLLLDEVTVDLDVVARMDLLDYFKEECEQVFTCFI
ncbi:ABC transporter I family member 21-like, partial [Quercus suber]|uniref:ABC transporter I family member 21-like n=1 Tax=Quercus suber TaxID=58331 RepID=UPI0032DECDB9